MTEVPKIVHDRLRAALPHQAGSDQPHPDLDLLAAFAEQALLPKERDLMLEHLAQCGDCREVLALAMPATEITAAVADETEETGAVAVSARAGKNTITWTKPVWAKLLVFSHLRWAALGACVVVVASVLVLHPGKVSQQLPPEANRSSEGVSSSDTLTASTSVPPSSISSSSVASSPTTLTPITPSSVASSTPMAKRLASRPANTAEPGKTPPQSQMELASTLKAQQLAPPEAESLLARNEAPPVEKAKPAPSAAEEQNVEVNAEEITQQKTDSVVVPGTIAVRSNAVSGAKLAPAPRPTLTPHNVSWTIAAGLLQRSLDSGRNWQTALRADRPLLCYASLDDDVWAGGQAGTLFHSADNGVSWIQVQPSIIQLYRPIERLTSDVSYIDFRSTKEIVLTTADHAVWRSADGGKTWEVK